MAAQREEIAGVGEAGDERVAQAGDERVAQASDERVAQTGARPADLTPPRPHPDLAPTGRVILGMIAFGKQTGYDIKQLVDRSTRHFWAASYGQIYPELKRLEEQGLIRGRSEPSGARARTIYELTPDGERALHAWLASPIGLLYELRDE